MDGRNSYSRVVLEKTISLSQNQKDILIKHASNGNPNEACALLFGSEKDGLAKINDIYLAQNIGKSPVSFTISNEELLQAYQLAEKQGLDVVGIYHSHPSSEAYPSSTDEKFMEINPVIWMISGSKNEFRAFVLESEIKEIQIKQSQN